MDTPTKPRFKVKSGQYAFPSVGGVVPYSRPGSAYFHGERNTFMHGFNPVLREQQEDVRAAWEKSAARTLSSFQNSGFMAGIVEVAAGSTVGSGLRMAARPDAATLGWKPKEAQRFTQEAEARFKAWGRNKWACDAAGMLTFNQMQQLAFASYLAYGEVLTLYPQFERKFTPNIGRIAVLPPTRLTNRSSEYDGIVQGVRHAKGSWSEPLSYFIRRKRDAGLDMTFDDVEIAANNALGRVQVALYKDPSFAARGISPFASVLKAYRQADQYFDANMTAAMLQNIFAAVMKSNIVGPAAWDALLTPQDQRSTPSVGPSPFSSTQFAAMKGEWYEGAKVDLAQHGRIAHLFPGDELEFTRPTSNEQQFDAFMSWLLRDISRGAGVTYENASGDYRQATYSSVRQAGAVEWLTVMRRRENIVVPWCDTAYATWLDEEIGTGRLSYKGGYEAFLREKEYAAKATWTGPPKPQADEFKAARAFEVRKTNFFTTLAEVNAEYGSDWDEVARQQAAERDYYKSLGLPDPWAPKEVMEVEGGQEAALNDLASDPGERKDSRKKDGKQRKSGSRNPGDKDRADSLNSALEAELEADLITGEEWPGDKKNKAKV